jgi:hypothetical protein
MRVFLDINIIYSDMTIVGVSVLFIILLFIINVIVFAIRR